MKESIFQRNIAYCWLFLFLSIVLEVCGTSFLKYSQDLYPKLGLLVVIIAISMSYFTLSKAIIRIPLGVAYAIWESAGLAFIVLISVFFLGESMDPTKATGLFMVFMGSVLIHQGTGKGKAKKAKKLSATAKKIPEKIKTGKVAEAVTQKSSAKVFADKGAQ